MIPHKHGIKVVVVYKHADQLYHANIIKFPGMKPKAETLADLKVKIYDMIDNPIGYTDLQKQALHEEYPPGKYKLNILVDAQELIRNLPLKNKDLAKASGMLDAQISIYRNGHRMHEETLEKIIRGVHLLGEIMGEVK